SDQAKHDVTRPEDRGQAQGRQAGAHAHGHGEVHAHNERSIGWAALLTGVFMVAEAGGGLLAGSLALLAHAGHMLTDAASLPLAWLAFRMAHRPAAWQRPYGLHRFPCLAGHR